MDQMSRLLPKLYSQTKKKSVVGYGLSRNDPFSLARRFFSWLLLGQSHSELSFQ